MTILGYLHLLQILILADGADFLSQYNDVQKKTALFIILLPIFLTLTICIRKDDLKLMVNENNHTGQSLKKPYAWLIVYMILSFLAFAVLASMRERI